MKYRVVSVLKDNRPRFLIISDIEEMMEEAGMDKDGKTWRRKSVEYILAERRKVIENATNSVAVDRYVAEHCITP